ncbi:30S ribosomal protein S7 [Alphaproteobacteria bacterium endosymbiont of Tiliacea citrago]|uniref:30S ribosomal protein S7 n=1 Tax=Alphaproteobacteria bacterium endosymbiont of Tiliacea citrago TaxID=3077944 RepID=UPI00313C17CB
MSRRKKTTKRELEVDYKYGKKLVTKLINYVMRDGKKDVARNIVYRALDLVQDKTKLNPAEIFEEAVNNSRPYMQVKSRRVGGATYPVPMEVSQDKSIAFALKWMVEGVEERPLKDAVKDLAQIIIDSHNNTGFVVKKRDEMHRQAEANKAFAHFRW